VRPAGEHDGPAARSGITVAGTVGMDDDLSHLFSIERELSQTWHTNYLTLNTAMTG
jgi:hypothetical protein